MNPLNQLILFCLNVTALVIGLYYKNFELAFYIFAGMIIYRAIISIEHGSGKL